MLMACKFKNLKKKFLYIFAEQFYTFYGMIRVNKMLMQYLRI